MKPFHKIEKNADCNNDLLDKLLQVTGLKNDAALSKALDVAPPVISKLRHGRLAMGATIVIRAHEVSGLSIKEIKQILIGDAA